MATQSRQSQGGVDESVSTRQPSKTVSTRVQPEQVTVVEQSGPPKTTRTVTDASTTRTVAAHKVGFTLSFSLQINGSLPPKLIP